jgi:hypothetical protein
MSTESTTENVQALTALDLQRADRVLEIGFGHGRTIEHAAASVPHPASRMRSPGCSSGDAHQKARSPYG